MQKILILGLAIIMPVYSAYGIIGTECNLMKLQEQCEQLNSGAPFYSWMAIDDANYQGYYEYSFTVDTINCSCRQMLSSPIKYRCAFGYWGPESTNIPTCTACGVVDGITATSVAGNNTTQAGCYLPKNSTGNDDSGQYKLTADCPY